MEAGLRPGFFYMEVIKLEAIFSTMCYELISNGKIYDAEKQKQKCLNNDKTMEILCIVDTDYYNLSDEQKSDESIIFALTSKEFFDFCLEHPITSSFSLDDVMRMWLLMEGETI